MPSASIITFGCTQNHSDSEIMSGLLEKAGFSLTTPDTADVVIINSCTVKNLAESKLYRSMNAHKNKPLIIAGCVPQAEQNLLSTTFKDVAVIGTTRLSSIAQVARSLLAGMVVHDLAPTTHTEDKLAFPSTPKNKATAIIPISEGCLSACTYCKTKSARGALRSYSASRIVNRATQSIENGSNIILLTSQDCAVWGVDRKKTLPHLLSALLEIPGEYKIRLGMANPDYIHKNMDELIELFKDERMFKFIHIPLQAGSDEVLHAMRRTYTYKQFKDIVQRFRAEIPDITIATDIIVGYPTESEKDFQATCVALQETMPDVVNISRFWPRPHTPAADLEPLPAALVQERTAKVREIAQEHSQERLRHWIGWKGKVIVDNHKKEGSVMSRNYAYIPIAIEEELPLGTICEVEIKKNTKYYCVAQKN